MKGDDIDALFHVSYGVRAYDILTSYPLTGFSSEKHMNLRVANLGLMGKMSGAAAVVDNKITESPNGRVLIDTNLKALGVLGNLSSNFALITHIANTYRRIHI